MSSPIYVRAASASFVAGLCVFAAISGAVLTSAWAQSTGPTVSHYTLPNGLELVVIPDHRAPVATHMIWYKVGAADETPGKSGLAHFLEHLMFKGTAKNPAGLFSQVVSTIGGQENAFTASDYTGYYQRVPADQLRTVMEFEADRMTGLVLTDQVVLPERDVILEEQNQRVANNPGARLGEQIDAALFLNHPYGKPVIGWRHEMEQLSRDDALAFYKRFYGPNNAIVVIAGDVDADKVHAMVEDTYGKVARRSDIGPRLRPQEPPPAAARSLTLADPRVEQPSLSRDYLVPSFATAQRGESEALEVLAHILGAGSNSRLYRALVVEQGVAVSAGAWYQGSALDMNKFGVHASPRPGVTLPQLEGGVDDVIAVLIAKGISAEELERAKTRLIADAVYTRDSQAALARWYGAALTTGSKVEDVLQWPDRIKAVSATQVQDAARHWLDKRRSVTGYLIKDTSPRVVEKRS
ncbi:MAG: M16 family metallopeptidase [Pseudolabrys sp.]